MLQGSVYRSAYNRKPNQRICASQECPPQMLTPDARWRRTQAASFRAAHGSAPEGATATASRCKIEAAPAWKRTQRQKKRYAAMQGALKKLSQEQEIGQEAGWYRGVA